MEEDAEEDRVDLTIEEQALDIARELKKRMLQTTKAECATAIVMIRSGKEITVVATHPTHLAAEGLMHGLLQVIEDAAPDSPQARVRDAIKAVIDPLMAQQRGGG